MKLFVSNHCPGCKTALRLLKESSCESSVELVNVDEPIGSKLADDNNILATPVGLADDGRVLPFNEFFEEVKAKCLKSV